MSTAPSVAEPTAIVLNVAYAHRAPGTSGELRAESRQRFPGPSQGVSDFGALVNQFRAFGFEHRQKKLSLELGNLSLGNRYTKAN